ncbi:KIN14B-interacting protein At4g14310 [Linum perenne]
MSAPSTRRLRDRDVASAPKTATSQKSLKTLTPVSSSDRNPSPTFRCSSSAKENTRLGSRVHRPAIKQVPRVDKAAAAAAASAVPSKGEGSEVRARRSTSSVPRGRSQSPSDFIRVLRDSRFPKGESDNRSVSRGKKSGTRFVRDDKENSGFSAGLAKKRATWEGKNLRTEDGGRDLESNRNAESIVGLGPIKKNEGNARDKLNPDLKATESILKLDKFGVDKSDSDSKFDRVRGSGHKSAGKVRVSENRKEKSLVEDGTRNKVSDGYSSRLHEKLAFLEGKVKRIASDIKRTKEILDMNSPDASKVVLSDIQEKISGIEQAMVQVVGDSSKVDVKDKLESKVVDKNESERLDEAKILVKGLNNEELEARLFPHQKLLRNRTSLKVTSVTSQSHDGHFSAVGSCDKGKVSAEANPVELEFLASLSKEKKSGERSGTAGSELLEVQDVDGVEAAQSEDSSKMFDDKDEDTFALTADEKLEEFDDVENRPTTVIGEEMDETNVHQLNVVGLKPSTGGWFVSEGESVLLAHDDGSCSFHDIANSEVCAKIYIYIFSASTVLDMNAV